VLGGLGHGEAISIVGMETRRSGWGAMLFDRADEVGSRPVGGVGINSSEVEV
jgi:hypothetical protein